MIDRKSKHAVECERVNQIVIYPRHSNGRCDDSPAVLYNSKTRKRENTSGHPVQHNNIRRYLYIVPSWGDHDDVSPAINIRRRRRADLNAYARDAHKRCSDNARSPDTTTILCYSSLLEAHTPRPIGSESACVYITISCRHELVGGVQTHTQRGRGGVRKVLGIFFTLCGFVDV